jgi:transposase-like protein
MWARAASSLAPIGAVGVDSEGHKHVLAIREGATENATVVKELLLDLVARGVNPDPQPLFVIDGSKALRTAINAVFGNQHPLQRCRAHKLRNVMDHLPEDQKDQVKSAIRAAWRLDAKGGMARLKKLAEWLEREYPSAAASLREDWRSVSPSTGSTSRCRCTGAWAPRTSSTVRMPVFACARGGFVVGRMVA